MDLPGGDGDHHAGEHHAETEDADDRLLEDDSEDERDGTDDGDDASERDAAIGGATPPISDCRHEVGVITVEVALHLIEKPLLLFRQWHDVPLQLGCDAGPSLAILAMLR